MLGGAFIFNLWFITADVAAYRPLGYYYSAKDCEDARQNAAKQSYYRDKNFVCIPTVRSLQREANGNAD